MAFALRKGDSSDGGKDGVPIKERFRAWWNGDDLPGNPSRPEGTPAVEESDVPVTDEPSSSKSETAPDARIMNGEWSEARRELAEAVWSPGFVTPGGSKYVEKLVSGCSLTAAETMLEIGVGMGGTTRTIIGKFGNYVTAYERDKDLAEAAREHAITYDFDDKLEVINPVGSCSLSDRFQLFRLVCVGCDNQLTNTAMANTRRLTVFVKQGLTPDAQLRF